MILVDGVSAERNCGSILALKKLKTSNNMIKIGKYEHKI